MFYTRKDRSGASFRLYYPSFAPVVRGRRNPEPRSFPGVPCYREGNQSRPRRGHLQELWDESYRTTDSHAAQSRHSLTTNAEAGDFEEAVFAGGCFWCIEAPYDKLPGVISAISGYIGGPEDDPTYKQVSSGSTGHLEAVRVTYDPQKVTYRELTDFFWRQFDPTDAGGSFYDRGNQYTSAVFYKNDEQMMEAEASKAALVASGRFDKPIVTPLREATNFYQQRITIRTTTRKNSAHYNMYRAGSGKGSLHRDGVGGERKRGSLRLRAATAKLQRAELRQSLTPLQYR